jgi:hypothetical protein
VASLSFDFDSDSEESWVANSNKAPILLSTLHALKELLTTSTNPSISSSEKDKGAKSPLVDYFMDVTPRLLRLTQFKEKMVSPKSHSQVFFKVI